MIFFIVTFIGIFRRKLQMDRNKRMPVYPKKTHDNLIILSILALEKKIISRQYYEAETKSLDLRH
jgi:hypothetical protein